MGIYILAWVASVRHAQGVLVLVHPCRLSTMYTFQGCAQFAGQDDLRSKHRCSRAPFYYWVPDYNVMACNLSWRSHTQL